MKNVNYSKLSLIAAVSIAVVACNPLSKMAKKASLIKYEVTPNPLEMHGDSVEVAISGTYPAKFFHKKAIIEVTPTMVYEGGTKQFETTTLLGDAAEGEGTKISYNGGSFNFTDKIAYVPGMEKAELTLKATAKYKTKTKGFPDKKIGDGTKITPLLKQSDEKPLLGKDKFVKIIPRSISGEINYTVNSAAVSYKEMRDKDIKAFRNFLMEGKNKEFVFKGITISAYASPDGEISKNDNLANQRAISASKALIKEFKKLKVDAGKKDDFYSKAGKGEDWLGFKSLMQKSEIKDKDLIVRILEMYSDLDKRETEIKALAATYKEVSNEILPQLRRSQFTLNAEEKSKSDQEITALAASAPDSLTVEELLYAATLTNDLGAKLKVYQACQKVYPNDWRGHNNVGYIYLTQNKINDAKTALSKADKAQPNTDIVNNNLGIVAMWKGDRKKAKELYQSATSAGSEVNYNIGIINIVEGDYGKAVSNFTGENTFNVALAKVLNADTDGAIKAINASETKNDAISYYLKAIIGARTQNKDLMISNLKTAVEKDGSLKAKAKNDAEFIKYKADAEFQGLTN